MSGIAHPLREIDPIRTSLDIHAAVRLLEESVVNIVVLVGVGSDRQFLRIVFTLMVEVPLERCRILRRLVISFLVLRIAAVRSAMPRIRPAVRVSAGLFLP